MTLSPKDLKALEDYWALTGLASNFSPEKIAVMLSAVRSQPQIVQSSKINFMQSKGRSMRSKPVKTEFTCEFKRVEKSMRPYRGMAYRITVHVPYDLRLSDWETRMVAWCSNQWGNSGHTTWRNDRGYFYFSTRQQAMTFKLAWHGTSE